MKRLMCSALLVHLLLLKAAMDSFFSSPLETDLAPVKSTEYPPAKRVVLFIADGLRAQSIYNEHPDLMPHLHSIRYDRGSWGISHANAPTESRPGHMAILGGVFEDPSVVFNLCRRNPVKIDTVINESANAWCWGYSSIVKLVTSDGRPQVHGFKFGLPNVDFARKDPYSYDLGVSKDVQRFFNEEKGCKTCDDIRMAGNLFFIYLLGMDMVGHAYKPFSRQYQKNLEVLDEIIMKLERAVNDFFSDNATTFIFTADHGMTDWGAHGSDSIVETYTPFIAWGAGIKEENTPKDIRQIDIAPFISALLGNCYPKNSLGRLPYRYLDLPEENVTDLCLSNAEQLWQIYEVKMQKISRYSLFHRPYLLPSGERLSKNFFIGISMNKERICQELINHILDGIAYYQNYYRINILNFTCLGFVGWILYLGMHLIDVETSDFNRYHCDTKTFKALFSLMFILLVGVCVHQSHPFMYYIYYTFPLVTWYLIMKENGRFLYLFLMLFSCQIKKMIIEIILFVSCLILLIYGFYHRRAFTYVMWLTPLWLFASDNYAAVAKPRKLTWIALCLMLSVFPSLPEMVTNFHIELYTIGSAVFLIVMHYVVDWLLEVECKTRNPESPKGGFLIAKVCFYSAPLYVISIKTDVIRAELPVTYLPWLIVSIPMILFPKSPKLIPIRTAAMFLALAPFYMMTSMAYEILFLAMYTLVIGYWLLVETQSTVASLAYYEFGKKYQQMSTTPMNNLRMSLTLMSLILVGYFGTGSIATMNGFDPMWVRCFVTVYNFYVMAALIIFKLVIPFLYTLTIFVGMVTVLGSDITKLFGGVLFISDIMVMYFLLRIKNYGSWMFMGISISHFIVMVTFIFNLILGYTLIHLLTRLSYKKICITNGSVKYRNLL